MDYRGEFNALGGGGIGTGDLTLTFFGYIFKKITRLKKPGFLSVVGPSGIEPETIRL